MAGNPEFRRFVGAKKKSASSCWTLAECLLNNRLQMRCFSATKEFVTQTKQTKISLCEQVRGISKPPALVKRGIFETVGTLLLDSSATVVACNGWNHVRS
jgi:hypothetical protein